MKPREPKTRPQQATAKERNLSFWECYTLLARIIRYGQSLSPNAFRVLLFIYDRTYAWDQVSASIPRTIFLKGAIRKRDRLRICYGLGICEKTLRLAIAELVDAGAIKKWRGNRSKGVFYAINPNWHRNVLVPMFGSDNDSIILPGKNDLPSPGIKEAVEEGKNYRPNLVHSSSKTIYISARKKPRAGVEEILEEKVSTLRTGTSERERGLVPSSPNRLSKELEKLWRTEMSRSYPIEPNLAWTAQQRMAFYRTMLNANVGDRSAAFVTFAVKQFMQVVRQEFRWMKERPATPSVPFVIRFIDRFVASFFDWSDPGRYERHYAKQERQHAEMLEHARQYRVSEQARRKAERGAPMDPDTIKALESKLVEFDLGPDVVDWGRWEDRPMIPGLPAGSAKSSLKKENANNGGRKALKKLH